MLSLGFSFSVRARGKRFEGMRQAGYVFRFEYERRKYAQHPGVTASPGQYVALEQCITHLDSRPVTDQAEQQAHALNLLHGTGHALLANLSFACAHVIEQSVRLDGLDDGDDRGCRYRSAAESGAKIAGAEMRRNILRAQNRAAGNTAAQCFGAGENIRRNTECLDGEELSRPADAGLNLVSYEQNAVALRASS